MVIANSPEAMEDPELQELRALKAKLVSRVCKLRDELKMNNRSSQNTEICFKNLITKPDDEPSLSESLTSQDKDLARRCEVSQSIFGVRFKDIDKNWLQDDVYRYKMQVVSKALQFALDLTVDVKENSFTIKDINCHFVSLEKCYLQEIAPWIQRFTRDKNFSRLITGVSDYSEQSIVRAKILRTLETKDYVILDKCCEEGGGLCVYVRSPRDADKVFFKFLWSLRFVDRSWRMEHIFAIHTIDADDNFVAENKELLEGFCEIGLRKADLEDLWNSLCTAIDAQEQPDGSDE